MKYQRETPLQTLFGSFDIEINGSHKEPYRLNDVTGGLGMDQWLHHLVVDKLDKLDS